MSSNISLNVPRPSPRSVPSVVVVALVAVLICLGYLGWIYLRYDRDPSEFVRPTPAGAAGYDGQFSYCIALDPNPATVRPCLDVPAYRYQRILHPMLARLAGFGNANWILYALVGVNLAALGLGTAVLAVLLKDRRASVWLALAYALFGGIFFAVRASTTEPLAYGLAILGFALYERKRVVLAAVVLLLAVLAKEVAILVPFGLGLHALIRRDWRSAGVLLLITALPYAVWQGALYQWFGSFGVGSGGAMATPFEVIPFMGIFRIAGADGRLFLILGGLLLIFAVLPTLYGLINGGRAILTQREAVSAATVVLFVSAAIMPFVPFSTYREMFGIARFMPGLVFALLLFAAERRDRRALRYVPIWIVWGVVLLG